MHLSLRLASLFVLISLVKGEDSCPKLKPAYGLEINQVLGTWYAVRGIEHNGPANNTSAKQTKSCPIIKILSKNDNVIEFQWNSKDKPQKKIELQVNKNSPGYLEQANKKGNQKASFRSLQISIQGSMRNVIGVTMCKSGGRVASVILNREPNFTENEVQIITSLLGSQDLSVNNIYDRCVKTL